tara:strand:+ start:116500 stop:116790 length:291 start_codon:yes stop_codon:yes gene_type:complete
MNIPKQKRTWWQRLLCIETHGGEISNEGKEILKLAGSKENWTPVWEKTLKDAGIDIRTASLAEIQAFRKKSIDDHNAKVRARHVAQAEEELKHKKN